VARELDLDYVKDPTHGRWAGWVMLAIAIVFAADLGRSYVSLNDEVAETEALLERTTRGGPVIRTAVAAGVPSEEVSAARRVVSRFAIPWSALFQAVESVPRESVALLSIEPDPEAGIVTITGEAKDYLAALTYVARLRQQPGLARVHLARHETRTNESQRPVVFTISASWRRS